MQASQVNELERRVDEVLFYIWDPLGFKAEPFTRYEYRGYVSEVLSYLENNKTSEEIEELLIEIVNNRMGLDFSRESTLSVAKLLIRHKKSIDSEKN
ncbi:MAG: hypothetical protein ACRBDX_11315 [Gammaproteobacteria bacterium]